MANKRFGHVGDENAPHIPPEQVPHFDQNQVTYLRKVFLIGSGCPIMPASVDDAVRVISWTNIDQGNREVIDHIENLVFTQKGAI